MQKKKIVAPVIETYHFLPRKYGRDFPPWQLFCKNNRGCCPELACPASGGGRRAPPATRNKIINFLYKDLRKAEC